ncbi:MAG TPA: nitroreductase family protein [Streptosporangiaceae bacterium]|nr:nitroreductase family protein [Streptosporangiaceae bacterium]
MTVEDTARDDGPGGPAEPSRRLLDELLVAAMAAPSMHNTQPWRFRLREAADTIELYADPDRMLPIGDPHGRAAYLGCGAALLNLRLAVVVAGLRPDVRLLPDPGQPLLLARMVLTEPDDATEWERELHAAIPRRQTNREPFSNRAVPPGIRLELAEAAAMEGAILRFPHRRETERLLSLAADAERGLLADPGYRAELARWAGGQRDRDGIPASAFGSRSLEGGTPVRDFRPHPPAEAARYAWFEEHPQLAVLSVRFGGARDWLATGQALQRVWLTATCRGISVCPLTQALETADAWLVREHGPGSGQPQMILRIGYGLPIPPGAPRRPVAEVIDQP